MNYVFSLGQFPPEEQAIELEEAIRCAIDGDALLFVGAGLSFLAYREDGQRVPDANSLVDLLLEQPLGTGSKHALDRVSGSVLRENGVEFVYDILRTNFIATSINDKLKTLYSLPWKRIYTTNYDNAIELARTGTRPVSSVTIDEPQSCARNGSIIHLNGYIKRISPANLERQILLTDASYAASRLVDTGWLSFFERDIKTSRAVIFAGYSLYDLEIDKALLSADALSRRAFFFISPTADKIEISTLDRYGKVVHGGIDELVKNIDEVKSDYSVPRFATGFTCLRELSLSSQCLPSHHTAAQLILQQFVYGRLPEQQVLSEIKAFDDQTYIVVREQDKEARKLLNTGKYRDVVFTGEIASGKSASSLTLAAFLKRDGYRVYYAQKGDILETDLTQLCLYNDKAAVIFDGYSSFRREISKYAEKRPATHRIILTERSAVHDLVSPFIDETKNLGPVLEVALNKISTSDAPEFEALTNFGGFWGHNAGASIVSRQKIITEKLDGSLYRLLIEIIKSEKIQEQLRAILSPLSKDEPASKLFCSTLIVNSLGFDFSISEWQYLFDRQLVRRMLTSYSDEIRNFILSDSDQIYVRNGVLSSYILHAFMNNGLIRECIIDLYERAESRSNESERWKTLRIELTKFSSIEPMFSDNNKSENVFGYYDAIRIFGKTKDNPDYWLQLGIASTVFDDLKRGVLCFDNAYARERARTNPNMTRIDNYFSRFQMRQAVAENDRDVAFSTFIKANKRLEKQIFLDINHHYPFKTGRYFSDIAAKHYEFWNKSQKEAFKYAATNIRKKAQEWKDTKREFSADVEILIREINTLIKKI